MADVQNYFNTQLPERISGDPEAAKEVDGVFLFRVTGEGGGTWTVNLKDEVGVTEGEAGEADCTLELSTDNMSNVLDDPSVAMQLFFSGDLKVEGNQMLATKLQQVIGG